MLNELFPTAHKRYSSLPILGAIADDFTDWLRAQGYCKGTARLYVRTLPDLDHVFQQQGWGELHDLTRQDLRSCRPANSQANRNLAAAVHAVVSLYPAANSDHLNTGYNTLISARV